MVMSLAPQIRSAKQIIGESKDDDYVIAPVGHAELYEKDAPQLASVLRDSGVATTAQEYELHDHRAVQAQVRYKDIAGRANITVLVTACAGAVIMLVALFDFPGWRVLWFAMGLFALASGAYGAVLSYVLKHGSLFHRWMRARAAAESHRLEYFRRLSSANWPIGSDSGVHLGLLQLEYFCRYQLEVQVSYYDSRQLDHQRGADVTAWIGGLAIALAAVATGLAGMLGSGVDSGWAGIAALGIAGAALASFARAKEIISQDSRNSERYERTRGNIQQIKVRLDEVRRAVFGGNREALLEFVAVVHEQLSLEHRQWLDSTRTTSDGMTRLEAALSRDRDKAP
jgi:hypothetical protein